MLRLFDLWAITEPFLQHFINYLFVGKATQAKWTAQRARLLINWLSRLSINPQNHNQATCCDWEK